MTAPSVQGPASSTIIQLVDSSMHEMEIRSHCGQRRPASEITVIEDNESLIRTYLEWKTSYTRRAANVYSVWVKRFQQQADTVPECFTIQHWTAFAISLRERYSPKCVQFALSVIHNYLRFWHEQGRLLRLPLYLARVPAAMAKSHVAVTEDEYYRILKVLRTDSFEDQRNLAIIMLLHDTGMRVGELTGLEIDQIEEDASAVIRTEKSVQRRQVFWNQDTDRALHRYMISRINSHPKTEWLFARANGGKVEVCLTSRTVQRVLRAACGRAGIERSITPHCFRHAFIHRLASLGVPDAILAQLLGHSSPLSISHYTKLSRPEAEEFARKQFRTLALSV